MGPPMKKGRPFPWGMCLTKALNNQGKKKKNTTPPKFNIEPENDGLEDDFPFPGLYSQVPGVYTSFG